MEAQTVDTCGGAADMTVAVSGNRIEQEELDSGDNYGTVRQDEPVHIGMGVTGRGFWS